MVYSFIQVGTLMLERQVSMISDIGAYLIKNLSRPLLGKLEFIDIGRRVLARTGGMAEFPQYSSGDAC